MEKDLNKSSPDKSPSDESHHDEQPRTLDGGINDVVSRVNVETEETKVVVAENIVQGSQEVGSGKKRGRGDDQGGTSGVQKGKKKGELTDPPSSEPKCATCGKAFGSWKAVFGHLRSHPDRDYRGAFPPPKIWEQMLRERSLIHQQTQTQDIDAKNQQELIASTLLNVARDVSSKLVVGERRGLGIDLNDSKEPETETEIETESSDLRKGVFPFDLNMPPPGSDEDDDNSKDES